MSMKPILAAAASVALAGAVPTTAAAQHRDNDRDDGIGVGEVIAGAVIVGGIAAALGAFDKDDRYDDRAYGRAYDPRYRSNYGYQNANALIERCVIAAEQTASRYGYAANVTQVEEVDRRGRYLRVEGDIEVADNRYYRNSRWDRQRRSSVDRGEFECRVDFNGRVNRMDYSGIRNL